MSPPWRGITTIKTRFDFMGELISKEKVLELIEEHSDLFDGYTDQQTFKDLIMALPTVIQIDTPIKNAFMLQEGEIDINGQPRVYL